MLTNCTQIAPDIILRKSQDKWDGMVSKHTNSLVQNISHQNFLSKTFVLLKKSQDEWHNKIQVYKFSHLKNTITNQNFFLKDSHSISPY